MAMTEKPATVMSRWQMSPFFFNGCYFRTSFSLRTQINRNYSPWCVSFSCTSRSGCKLACTLCTWWTGWAWSAGSRFWSWGWKTTPLTGNTLCTGSSTSSTLVRISTSRHALLISPPGELQSILLYLLPSPSLNLARLHGPARTLLLLLTVLFSSLRLLCFSH